MKKIVLIGLRCFAGWPGWPWRRKSSTWLTDLPAAQAKAKAENKLVLLDFTGSDWCLVQAIEQGMFSTTRSSRAYAAKNLVLVNGGFSRTHKRKARSIKKGEQGVAGEKYNIEGFPTIIFWTGTGRKWANIGYEPVRSQDIYCEAREVEAKHSSKEPYPGKCGAHLTPTLSPSGGEGEETAESLSR